MDFRTITGLSNASEEILMLKTVIFLSLLTALGIGMGTPSLWAEELPLIPREIIFGNPDRSNPRISPDGQNLAYLAPASGVMNVYVRTLGKDDDVLITSDKKRGIRSFFWQYDNEHVIYLQDKDGDENWHYFQTNVKTKMTRDLTPFEGIQARVVRYEPEFPDQMLVALNIRDRSVHDVYRLNLKNGALEPDTENSENAVNLISDNALQIRILEKKTPEGGTELKLRKDGKSPWTSFMHFGPDDIFGGIVGFSKDNKAVRIISSVGASAARLLEVDPETGKQTQIAQDPIFDVTGSMIHPTERKPQAVAIYRDRLEWTFLDDHVKDSFEALKKIRDGDINVSSRDLADKIWIVNFIQDNAPGLFYAFERSSQKATFLFSNQPALEKFTLAKMKPVSFIASDGLVIHGYLTTPAGKEPKNLPLIMYVHGGPWGRDSWGYNAEVQWLANRGYAVFMVNFRGSTGYGKTFLNAGDREWGAKMSQDILDAKAWAISQGVADPKKVAIMGGSYGGYATLVGLAFTPDEFACGVDIVGPSNIATLIKSIPPYWAPMKALFDKRIGKLETEEEFLNSRSPLHRADRIKKPLLIGQGANDPRVKKAESDQIVEAMRKNHLPVEYLVFPDEGHGFARPENRLKFYAAAEQFLAKHLGGRAEPPSEAEKWETLKQ